MPLESATFISDLNVANPVTGDVVAQGDDHFRLLKTVIKATLPNADKAFYFPDSVHKTSSYVIQASDLNKLITVNSNPGSFDLTLPSLGAADDGWGIWVIKTEALNTVTVIGTINGETNLEITAAFQATRFFWTGTMWLSAGVPTLPIPLASLNIVNATQTFSPAVDDLVPIYSLSAEANRQIPLEVLLRVINDIAAETAVAADDIFMMYDTSAAAIRSVTAANVQASASLPTRQVLLSGTSATYTTPTGARQLKIRMIGGGGGGGARQTNNGSGGTASTFNSIEAAPGFGGAHGSAGRTGGAGGSGGAGSASLRIAGGDGANGDNVAVGSGGGLGGGHGGSGAFGGAGRGGSNAVGSAAKANSGGGGGAGANNETGGGGGGSGEYIEIIISSPAGSYTYTVGGGGAGGTAGSVAGGNGGSGIIIVDEIY